MSDDQTGISIHSSTGRGLLTVTMSIDTETVRLCHGADAIEVGCDAMKRRLLSMFREAHTNYISR